MVLSIHNLTIRIRFHDCSRLQYIDSKRSIQNSLVAAQFTRDPGLLGASAVFRKMERVFTQKEEVVVGC